MNLIHFQAMLNILGPLKPWDSFCLWSIWHESCQIFKALTTHSGKYKLNIQFYHLLIEEAKLQQMIVFLRFWVSCFVIFSLVFCSFFFIWFFCLDFVYCWHVHSIGIIGFRSYFCPTKSFMLFVSSTYRSVILAFW